jgi:uncharacterized protein (TIGR03437 family)
MVGTSVAITGTGLTGISSVRFGGGVSAVFTVVSDTRINAIVPTGARNGAITVSGPNGSATSSQNVRVSKR